MAVLARPARARENALVTLPKPVDSNTSRPPIAPLHPTITSTVAARMPRHGPDSPAKSSRWKKGNTRHAALTKHPSPQQGWCPRKRGEGTKTSLRLSSQLLSTFHWPTHRAKPRHQCHATLCRMPPRVRSLNRSSNSPHERCAGRRLALNQYRTTRKLVAHLQGGGLTREAVLATHLALEAQRPRACQLGRSQR